MVENTEGIEIGVFPPVSLNGFGDGFRYGLASVMGRRDNMEDTFRIQIPLSENLSKWSFAAVFDGHNGKAVAEMASEKLPDCVISCLPFSNLPDFKAKEGTLSPNLRQIPDTALPYAAAIVDSFLDFDANIQAEFGDTEQSGSTTVAAFISSDWIFLANCGDSRGVLTRGGKIILQTADHKPSKPDELQRIKKAGGHVRADRINGIIGVSRSLGDFEYKSDSKLSASEQLISPRPDIFCVNRDRSQDELLILASDGIWDVFPSEELVSFILHRMQCTENLSEVCNDIIDTCLYRPGCADNMTLIIIAFDATPKFDVSAQELDQEINQRIQKMIHDTMQDNPQIKLPVLKKTKLGSVDFADLKFPESKHKILERAFYEASGKNLRHRILPYSMADEVRRRNSEGRAASEV